VCARIQKYCKRGIKLLEPINFDGDFNMLMKEEDVPLCQVKQYIMSIMMAKYRLLQENIIDHLIDTFRLQEIFIATIHPQLSNYA